MPTPFLWTLPQHFDSTGAMRFFHKAILSNPVALKSGRRIPWESIGGDNGVIALEVEEVAAELDELIKARRGGVREIDSEEFEELKKKADPSSLPRSGLKDPWIDPNPPKIARLGVEDAVVGGSHNQPPPKINEPPPQRDSTEHTKPPMSFGSRPKSVKAPKAAPGPAAESPPSQ